MMSGSIFRITNVRSYWFLGFHYHLYSDFESRFWWKMLLFHEKVQKFWLLRASMALRTNYMSPKTFATCSATTNWLGGTLKWAESNWFWRILRLKKSAEIFGVLILVKSDSAPTPRNQSHMKPKIEYFR